MSKNHSHGKSLRVIDRIAPPEEIASSTDTTTELPTEMVKRLDLTSKLSQPPEVTLTEVLLTTFPDAHDFIDQLSATAVLRTAINQLFPLPTANDTEHVASLRGATLAEFVLSQYMLRLQPQDMRELQTIFLACFHQFSMLSDDGGSAEKLLEHFRKGAEQCHALYKLLYDGAKQCRPTINRAYHAAVARMRISVSEMHINPELVFRKVPASENTAVQTVAGK